MDWFLYDNGPRHERVKDSSCASSHLSNLPKLTNFICISSLIIDSETLRIFKTDFVSTPL